MSARVLPWAWRLQYRGGRDAIRVAAAILLGAFLGLTGTTGVARADVPDGFIVPSTPGATHYDVYPADAVPLDRDHVQWAVDNVASGGEVLLKAGRFRFGEPANRISPTAAANAATRVVIGRDVKLLGETDPRRVPLTTIRGGVFSFYSPLPPGTTPANPPAAPGPDITIQGIQFEGAFYTPVMIAYSRSVKLVGNRVRDVHPWAAWLAPGSPVIYRDLIDGSSFQIRIQEGFSIGTRRTGGVAYIPNAVVGTIEIRDNDIDMTIDPTVDPSLGIVPHTPRNTLGEGMFVNWATGAALTISGNYIANASRNGIEPLDNYRDADGNGSVVIERNTVITPQDGIAYPGATCPNAIVTGNFLNSALGDAHNAPHVIAHNTIENHSTRRGAGIISLADGAVITNNQIVVEGGSTNPGAGGLPSNIGILVLADFCSVGENQIRGEGSYAISVLRNSAYHPYLSASDNVLIGNDLEGFQPSSTTAQVLFSAGFVLNQQSIPGASDNLLIGGSGSVVDLGVGNVCKGGFTLLDGTPLNTPGGVGDEVSSIKDYWNLP